MFINLPLKTPNGSVATVHRIRRIEVGNEAILAIIDSYADEEQQAILWQDGYDLPAEALCAAPFAAAYQQMVSPTGAFEGGALIEDPTSLEAAQAKAWQRIKYQRAAVEQAGCDTLYGRVDTTEKSRTILTGAIQASSLVLDFTLDFTMADNTAIKLDAEAVREIGLAVFAFVDLCHQRSRDLRAFIGSCEDIEVLDLVNWETDLTGTPSESV